MKKSNFKKELQHLKNINLNKKYLILQVPVPLISQT